jgi:hypothetical protein
MADRLGGLILVKITILYTGQQAVNLNLILTSYTEEVGAKAVDKPEVMHLSIKK